VASMPSNYDSGWVQHALVMSPDLSDTQAVERILQLRFASPV
jgi:hypothetical protein